MHYTFQTFCSQITLILDQYVIYGGILMILTIRGKVFQVLSTIMETTKMNSFQLPDLDTGTIPIW